VFFIFFGLPLLGLSFSPWSAAILANAQTVESIKKGGVLKVGAQVAQVPWGFTDSSGKLTGFDIEVMEMSCLASLRWQ
jgi:ABC-type amino acid transport substrate-binding protein